MTNIQGNPLPLGVSVRKESVNFSIVADKGRDCELLLYKKGETVPTKTVQMKADTSAGTIRCIAFDHAEVKGYEYNYRIDGEIIVDPYAKSLTGRTAFNQLPDFETHEIRGQIVDQTFDWEEDRILDTPYENVVAYSLHVRGFTKHSSSKVRHKGTFQGVIEKIPYLLELGINQIQCMPIYDFWESPKYVNYWGYGPGFFFTPKASFASSDCAVRELKEMVKACHKAGIEVVLDFPFTGETPFYMVQDCLRYYAQEYHVDGFILDPGLVDFPTICADPFLQSRKIMKKQQEFQNTMRKFLKGDEGMVESVIWWTKHHSKDEHIFNYIANHNGFALLDVVSYDGKHNEANGEQNRDGTQYNYSWNCGAEGPSRKKAVTELRKKQIRNAFFLVLMSQGTPCILAGDEFGNTQKGNNNVYCQDNETSWLDWKKLEKEKELFAFVKSLILFRQNYAMLRPNQERQGLDYTSCGVPDVSYHGEYAWRVPSEVASRQLGVYYNGGDDTESDIFIGYNMHWEEHIFALPALSKGKKWYKVLETDQGVLREPVDMKEQKEIEIEARTIALFIGR